MFVLSQSQGPAAPTAAQFDTHDVAQEAFDLLGCRNVAAAIVGQEINPDAGAAIFAAASNLPTKCSEVPPAPSPPDGATERRRRTMQAAIDTLEQWRQVVQSVLNCRRDEAERWSGRSVLHGRRVEEYHGALVRAEAVALSWHREVAEFNARQGGVAIVGLGPLLSDPLLSPYDREQASTNAVQPSTCGAVVMSPPNLPEGSTSNRRAMEAGNTTFADWERSLRPILECRRNEAQALLFFASLYLVRVNAHNELASQAAAVSEAWRVEINEWNEQHP